MHNTSIIIFPFLNLDYSLFKLIIESQEQNIHTWYTIKTECYAFVLIRLLLVLEFAHILKNKASSTLKLMFFVFVSLIFRLYYPVMIIHWKIHSFTIFTLAQNYRLMNWLLFWYFFWRNLQSRETIEYKLSQSVLFNIIIGEY